MKKERGTHIISERTSLNCTSNYTIWAYDGEKHNMGLVKRSAYDKESIQFPFSMQFLNGQYAHEAEIVEFAPFVMNTTGDGHSLAFDIDYNPRTDAFKTSWRAILLGCERNILFEINSVKLKQWKK